MENTKNLMFTDAIKFLLRGERLRRETWREGCYIYHVKGTLTETDKLRGEAREHIATPDNRPIVICNHIDMKTYEGNIVVGWSPSQEDMIGSSDWKVI